MTRVAFVPFTITGIANNFFTVAVLNFIPYIFIGGFYMSFSKRVWIFEKQCHGLYDVFSICDSY